MSVCPTYTISHWLLAIPTSDLSGYSSKSISSITIICIYIYVYIYVYVYIYIHHHSSLFSFPCFLTAFLPISSVLFATRYARAAASCACTKERHALKQFLGSWVNVMVLVRVHMEVSYCGWKKSCITKRMVETL